jgi:hypothetical protein
MSERYLNLTLQTRKLKGTSCGLACPAEGRWDGPCRDQNVGLVFFLPCFPSPMDHGAQFWGRVVRAAGRFSAPSPGAPRLVLTGSKMLVGGQSKSRCYPASLELGHQPRMSLVPKPECQDGKVPLTPCLLCVCWACTACCTGRLWPGAPEGTHPLFPPSWCAQGKTISRECICTLVTLPLCFWEFLS